MADTQPEPRWYGLSADDVAAQLRVNVETGLSTSEAKQRKDKYGPNKLAGKKKEPGWHRFFRQYRDFMQLLLVGAAAVNQVIVHELNTTLVLLGLTVFNAMLGMNQEAKAEASLAALEKMLKSIARVRRDGEVVEIEAEELVPGDIVLMEAGNRVPADGRLSLAANVEIEEAALTGESVASGKNTDKIAEADAPLGDRHNMAFMNTSVTRGRAEMIVTATGMKTEMGHIADLLNKTQADKTPLQKQLDRLTVIIAGLAGITFIIMIILGLAHGQAFDVVFLSGVALAISAIPTGMPAVVTTLYSMGTRMLASANAIVKRLPSVETLGSVSAICSDKTGTLTLNKMTAREFTIPGQNHFKVTGEGYATQGSLELTTGGIRGQKPWQKGTLSYSTDGQLLSAGGTKVDLDEVMLPMALCADARLDEGALIGDPTEGALIVLAEKGGISVDKAREMFPRVAEVPFDSDYKFMATFHDMKNKRGDGVVRCFVKGAPDVLIAGATKYWLPGGEEMPIGEDNRHLALAENDRMAGSGERVMVVARRDFAPASFDPEADLIGQVSDLTLLAMVGIVDPPRPEAKEAIAKCHSAGIQVRMITGDHAVTAAAIGHELGIEGEALTGAEFAALRDEELAAKLPGIGVVARVAPEDKIRLVDMLQKNGNIVAMTGDGVNDAPALKKADIGVAMGITGTEVSKEAAVMILTDDNFATIVKAVEYGRGIYDNLSKYIRFQMTALTAFIFSYLGAAIFSILGGTPFEPLTVLYINFAVQVPLAVALGFDKPSEGLMDRRPRPLTQPVLTQWQWIRLGFIGLVMAVGTLIVENYFTSKDPTVAASMGFVIFSLFSIVIGVTNRSETETALKAENFSDWRQLKLLGLALIVTILGTELGFLQRILGVTHLNGWRWLVCIIFAFGLLAVDEVIKYFLRRGRQHIAAAAAAPPPAGSSLAGATES
jgi:P-type Ca2+ transporter type 2C